MSKFFEVTVQIFEDDNDPDKVFYSVIQDFDSSSDDHEVLAHGEALSFSHASRLVADELKALFL